MRNSQNLRLNLDLLLLSLILLAINIPLWQPHLWPGDYTMMTLFNFYSVYNDFFLYHEIPHWFPFGAYGLPANFWQFHQLSPACYFVGFLGWCMRIKDTMILFKLSGFLEQVILLFGTYCLSAKIFKRRAAAFFTCLGTVMTSFWFYENFWNLRLYYLLPLTLYALILFFERKDSFYFWLSANLFAISLIGNLPYFFTLTFLIFLIFFLILCLKERSALKSLVCMSTRSWLACGLFFLMMASFYFFFAHSLQDIYVHKMGRDPNQWYSATLKDFLTCGMGIGRGKFGDFVFMNLDERYDSLIYAGLLPFFFVSYALIRCRNIHFFAVTAACVFVILFSLGEESFVATLVYYLFFPIRLFRYIGQVGPIIKFFILLIAGFGIESFLNDKERRESSHVMLNTAAAVALTSLFIVNVGWFGFKQHLFYTSPWASFYCFIFPLLLLTLATLYLGLWKFRFSTTVLASIAIISFALDLFAYRYETDRVLIRNRTKTVDTTITNVAPYNYQSNRTWRPLEPESRTTKAYDLIFSKPGFWMEAYDFSKFDPCLPMEPTIYEPIGLVNLTNAAFSIDGRGKIPLGMYMTGLNGFKADPRTAPFLRALGCDSPKLKLIPHALVAKSDEEAKLMVNRTVDIDQTIILTDPESRIPASDASVAPTSSLGSVQPISFRANKLTLTVNLPDLKNGWLYYADSYHSKWQAWVDGTRAPTLKANLAFKAIPIHSGTHQVEFRFVSGLRGSLIYVIALAGILFCFLLIIQMIGLVTGSFKLS